MLGGTLMKEADKQKFAELSISKSFRNERDWVLYMLFVQLFNWFTGE